ncbi:hypothetical protein C1H46_007177 [Malus baccata]|uniref:Uncharacterized protein n=1 Tax=Malus baccata TaxID=106549 RepID=A0A540N7T7_MALBA|nr:hypothetical protein C1H46_007177 [Malus baccata]
MNLSGSLSLNCEPKHPPPFDDISSLLLRWATSPPLLLLSVFNFATKPRSEKKTAAYYSGLVISSPMSVVPTSPLKNRFWFLSFTLAGVTERSEIGNPKVEISRFKSQCIDGYSIKKDRFWMMRTEELPQCLRSPTPRLELLQPEKVTKWDQNRVSGSKVTVLSFRRQSRIQSEFQRA